MTLNKDAGSILLIGGFSSKHGFSNTLLEYSLSEKVWATFKTETDGDEYFEPFGLYGHSTVYHSPTRSFYIYGGIVYYNKDDMEISNKLFALHYPSKTWSTVSIYSYQAHPNPYNLHELSSVRDPKPHQSIYHSSVTSDRYMAIIGGQQTRNGNERASKEPVVSIYIYRCRLWVNIYDDSPIVHLMRGEIDFTIAGSAGIDQKGKVYMMGGISQTYGVTRDSMIRMDLPEDSCGLYSSSKNTHICKTTLGCAHCSISDGKGTNSTFCYSNDLAKVL